jgi:biopolymer transport protein ExbB/TolQ
MELMMMIYLLVFVIFALCAFSVMQLKLAGLNVKDFWSFIEANQMLDKLYNFSKKYDKMSSQEQVIFLMEAEKVFDAFDKVPKLIWEEEYEKYMDVLNTYKNIKVLRWASN